MDNYQVNKTISVVLAFSIITILFVAGIWDIYVAIYNNNKPSVSLVLSLWIKQWPFLAFALGALTIHLIGLTPR